MKERRRAQSDRPWWVDREPNMARLQMAICRGAVVFGRDHVKVIANFNQFKREDSSDANNNRS